ncbi:SDR family oxidoreductase [Pseudonocardia xishanensis]|uniref:Short subunit dehydrogenase n=1 Tax=Pseudonocardia xishanensis TaxID=630995 RepID=A0ABP8RVB6_9PSEU
MSTALDHEVAIVTGAGKGLGRVTAERLGGEGATVVVSDIDLPAAEKVAAIPGATALACGRPRGGADQGTGGADRRAARRAPRQVSNAGVGRPEPLLAMDRGAPECAAAARAGELGAPTYMKTAMADNGAQTVDALGPALSPLGRLADGADVVNLLNFLASDEAACIPGSEYNLDGGDSALLSVD